MRPTPPVPPAVKAPRSEPARHFAVITPLVGGGVRPGEADPVQVVRGSEVRGQLRFWWRAARGGQFSGDLHAMKEVEDEIWGAASRPGRPRPSQVQIAIIVRPNETGQERNVEDLASLGYGTFPFNEEIKDGGRPQLREHIFFDLRIEYPSQSPSGRDYQAEVEAALWAWETFGGIGGRTRRGFGAISAAVGGMIAPGRFPSSPQQAWLQLDADLKKYVTAGVWPDGVPNLGPGVQYKFRPTQATVQRAHEDLLSRLKAFRQDRGPTGRARNAWPEPDAIRRLQPMPGRKHPPVSTVDKFPRAAFGLPIIFHFKDRDDPADTTLQGPNGERLASPLILRPLPTVDNKALGLALVLAGPRTPPGGVVLNRDNANTPVNIAVTETEQSQIPALRHQPDPLLAFLASL